MAGREGGQSGIEIEKKKFFFYFRAPAPMLPTRRGANRFARRRDVRPHKRVIPFAPKIRRCLVSTLNNWN